MTDADTIASLREQLREVHSSADSGYCWERCGGGYPNCYDYDGCHAFGQEVRDEMAAHNMPPLPPDAVWHGPIHPDTVQICTGDSMILQMLPVELLPSADHEGCPPGHRWLQ